MPSSSTLFAEPLFCMGSGTPDPIRTIVLFYSVNRNEKETATGADYLSRDLGIGEEIGGSGTSGAEEALRSLWSVLCSAHGASNRRRSLLGLPPSEN